MPRHLKSNPHSEITHPYNNPQAQHVIDETVELGEFILSSNSRKQYRPRQQRWKEWADKQNFFER